MLLLPHFTDEDTEVWRVQQLARKYALCHYIPLWPSLVEFLHGYQMWWSDFDLDYSQTEYNLQEYFELALTVLSTH